MHRVSVLRRCYSTEVPKKTVAINGAGLSGLTCALTLQKNGITPKIFDIASNYNHFKGQGIILLPHAMKVFTSLGVAEQIEKEGKVINKHILSNHRGYLHGTLHYEKVHSSYPFNAVGIDKYKLIKVLESNFKGTIQFGEEVTRAKLVSTGDKKQAHCTLRSPFHSGKFDVLVGADGVASKVRSVVIEPEKVKRRFPGWGVYSAVIKKPGFVEGNMSVEAWGAAKRFFIVPINDSEFYVYGTFNSRVPTSSLVNGKKTDDVFANEFDDFTGWGIPKILENLKNKEYNIWYPAEVRVDNWTGLENHAIVIGNAAHTFSPNSYQDVAMNVEDGYLLGSLLGVPNLTAEQAVNAAFKLRKPRVDERQLESFRAGTSGQMEPVVFGRARLVFRDVLLRWSRGNWSQVRLAKKLCSYDMDGMVNSLAKK